ncbi:hypothetical protein ABZ725_50405 [Streptomyces sp. NPDC006872]|uniref:hypothetical protein n=1 Tax=Streptomyces sp. NPDC006872 TaxID=3155720 RepID=UPI003406B8B5
MTMIGTEAHSSPPLHTHLDVLRDALERAATDGIYATPVPGSRALFVVDQYGCVQQGMSSKQFNERLQHAADSPLQRAGIAAGREDYNINATSLDSTARDPLRVPWANYPLHPVACARLIGDYAVATVETSGPVLTRLLQAAGLDALGPPVGQCGPPAGRGHHGDPPAGTAAVHGPSGRSDDDAGMDAADAPIRAGPLSD